MNRKRPMVPIRFSLSWVILLWLPVSNAVCADGDSMTLWYQEPASEWVEALPIGNGHFGAMVFGGTPRHATSSTTTRCSRANRTITPTERWVLPQLRQLLFDGRQHEAHRLANREFMSISSRGHNRQEAYQPFGDLTIDFPGHENVDQYRRELDIDRAIASVRYQAGGVTYVREVFASYPDDAIVVRLESDQPGKITCLVSLSSPHADTTTTSAGDNSLMTGKVEDGETRFEARLIVRTNGGSRMRPTVGWRSSPPTRRH